MELDHGDGAVYPTAPKNDILTDNILAKTGILQNFGKDPKVKTVAVGIITEWKVIANRKQAKMQDAIQ